MQIQAKRCVCLVKSPQHSFFSFLPSVDLVVCLNEYLFSLSLSLFLTPFCPLSLFAMPPPLIYVAEEQLSRASRKVGRAVRLQALQSSNTELIVSCMRTFTPQPHGHINSQPFKRGDGKERAIQPTLSGFQLKFYRREWCLLGWEKLKMTILLSEIFSEGLLKTRLIRFSRFVASIRFPQKCNVCCHFCQDAAHYLENC